MTSFGPTARQPSGASGPKPTDRPPIQLGPGLSRQWTSTQAVPPGAAPNRGTLTDAHRGGWYRGAWWRGACCLAQTCTIVHVRVRVMPGTSCCLLYTSDAADDLTRVDLGGRRI